MPTGYALPSELLTAIFCWLLAVSIGCWLGSPVALVLLVALEVLATLALLEKASNF